MTVKVTKCPAGFAHGYIPINGTCEIMELRDDTNDVCSGIDFNLMMQSRTVKNETLNKIERRLSRWKM